jgi:hypothetical protein
MLCVINYYMKTKAELASDMLCISNIPHKADSRQYDTEELGYFMKVNNLCHYERVLFLSE